MSDYDYKPIIPTVVSIMMLYCFILCVLHIGTNSYITTIAVIFLISVIGIGAFYIVRFLKGKLVIDVRQRLRNLHKLLPLRLVRLIFTAGAAYLWLVPVAYTPERFDKAMQVFEMGSLADAICVLAPSLPAPARDAFQRCGELIWQAVGIMEDLNDMQAEMANMSEKEKEEYARAYAASLNFNVSDIQTEYEQMERRTKIFCICVAMDLVLCKIISLIGTIRYKKYLKNQREVLHEIT